jgi:hypothetical protein
MFHLVFLRALVAKGEDKSLIALKGGCNLRFFFGSVRYSEDIDFDVVVMAKGTLKNKVERLLASPLVATPLRAHGLRVSEISAPKQTDTTQRWKVGLEGTGLHVPLRTKIEFSRRGDIEGCSFEGVARDVLRPYGLTQVLATHYGLSLAVAQKIHALSGRSEPQARDVFDLDLLFARPEARDLALSRAQKAWLPQAIERAMAISFDEYRSKVVSYLAEEQRALYEARHAWDAMQEGVVDRLEALQ